MSELHIHSIKHKGKSLKLSTIVDLHIKALIETGDLPEDTKVLDSKVDEGKERVTLKLNNGEHMTISWKHQGQQLVRDKFDA